MSSEERDPSLAPPRTSIAWRVTVLALLHACLVIMLKTAEGGALSLFLDHLGARRLPYVFLSISLADVPLTFVYLRLSHRVSTRKLLAALAVLLVVSLAGAHVLTDLHRGAGLFAAYMAATILNTFVVIHWGAALLEFFTVKEAMRAFPRVYLGAHVGGFVAGVLLRQLAVPVGTENLLWAVPAIACVPVLALTVVAWRIREGGEYRPGRVVRPGPPSAFAPVRKLKLLRTSSLLRIIAAATAVMVCLRLALRYSYGAGFEEAFPDSDDLTRFIGTYTIVASVGSIAMQALVTPTLLRWLGVGLLNAVYSYLMSAALLLSAIWPGLPTAVMGRGVDQDLKSAIKTPVSPMFYEAIGEAHRKDGRALILGIVSPIAALLASLTLVALTEGGIRPQWVVAGGAVLSILFVALCLLQGRAYGRALEALLVAWHEKETGSEDATLDEALRHALRSEDRRVYDMAREVRHRARKRQQ